VTAAVPDSEKGVEDLATVWYPRFVKWSPRKKKRKEMKIE